MQSVVTLFLRCSLVLALAACSKAPETASTAVTAPPAPPAKAKVGAWGFYVAGMDTSVRPGDDFYKYANGHWVATNKIPPDLTDWGAFTELALESEEQVH